MNWSGGVAEEARQATGESSPIDLGTLRPHSAAVGSPQVLTPSRVEKDYDPGPEQEKARAKLAYILLAVLVGLVVVQVITGVIGAVDCFLSPNCADAKNALALMNTSISQTFTPIVGLVGSVIGFYFGAKSKDG